MLKLHSIKSQSISDKSPAGKSRQQRQSGAKQSANVKQDARGNAKEAKGNKTDQHQANLKMASPMTNNSIGDTYRSGTVADGDLLKVEILKMKEAGETKAQKLRREANN